MKIIPESFYDKFSFFRDPTQAKMESEAGKEEISGNSNKPRSIFDNFVYNLANSIYFSHVELSSGEEERLVDPEK